jgi:serine/threonine protein kinase
MPKREQFFIDGVAYERESSLGQGGSATVWKVHRKSDGETFALKTIEKDLKEGSARNERFEREIEYGQTTTHPNVVRIHARAEDEKFFYYIMDFFPMTLRNVINEESDPDQLLDYARQLCEALAHVHGDGIVHRDLKPENVLVDPGLRRLVLADFGIAHFKESVLTKQGDLLVNRNYLAPEQMLKNNAHGVGRPADIFALGLVITEMFTKQNSRGARHAVIGDRYPFLADLDPIIEQMMLQDEGQRLRIDNVQALLRVVLQRLDATIEEIADDIRPKKTPAGVMPNEVKRLVDRAARDILSAKHLFERVTDSGLSRYNPNYHCELSYDVSEELFNTCAQAVAYSLCKAKFDYEGAGAWDEHDDALVAALRPTHSRDFDAILADFPLPKGSLWGGLPRQSAHLFRFCKDYHREELLRSIRESLYGESSNALRANLFNAPVLWVIRSVREYLRTDYFELDQASRAKIEIEQHLSVFWDDTFPLDSAREALGTELIDEPFNTNAIASALVALESRWDVSVGELVSGNYSVMFRSRESYGYFRDAVLALAEPDSVFEADVLDLLRPEAEYDDVVVLTWDRDFDVAITLGKVLGTHAR